MARSGRHLARRCAVQALYQWGVTGQSSQDIEPSFIKNENLSDRHLEYFQSLIKNIPDKIDLIDGQIAPHLDRDIEKIDLIEHAILRVATYELQFEKDIPKNVVIDEAIDLAKIFSSEHGYKFVNGVLDKIANQVRTDG